MALVLVESYERYAAAADIGTDNDDLTTQWTRDTNFDLNASGGRFGEQCADSTANGADHIMRFPNTRSGSNTFIAQFAFKPLHGGLGTIGGQMVCGMFNSSGLAHWRLFVMPTGAFYIANAANAEGNFAAPGHLRMNAWNYIQIKVVMTDTGSFTMKVNGATVYNAVSGDFSQSSGNTSNIQQFWFSGSAGNHLFNHVLLMDGSGATFNDFKSDMRYEHRVVDADGSVVDWTASAGSDFQCVDEALAAYNDDTDYISSGTTDQDSLFTHENIAAASGTIHFVAQMALSRSDTAGDKITLVCKSGGTTSVGADLALIGTTVTAYRWRKRFYETDPNTAAAWSVANIDAAEFGVRKRV
jgi:hypothetical protein